MSTSTSTTAPYLRLPLCDYPAESRPREEPRVRRQENGFRHTPQIKFTDISQKKVNFALVPILLDLPE